MQRIEKFNEMDYNDLYKEIKKYAERNRLDIVTLDTMYTKEYYVKYHAIVVFKERE